MAGRPSRAPGMVSMRAKGSTEEEGPLWRMPEVGEVGADGQDQVKALGK